jgi:spore maturation protein CgeB
MRFVIFCHSLLSDWNHGNAHFLRGVVAELQSRGHGVQVYEPADSWSLQNLLRDHGEEALEPMRAAYPELRPVRYTPGALELQQAVAGADVVIAHEWSSPQLVRELGQLRQRRGDFVLLFHDTHHRSATDPQAMAQFDLSGFDGVLAFGEVIRRLYLEQRWARRAWTFHEAADTRVFRPLDREPEGDLLWIGNWGDEERTSELRQFLLEPVERLGLRARVYGVRYPDSALRELQQAGIAYGGYLPNPSVPEVFARYRLTVHIPRRPYAQALPGIPTIRPFEAMACGIPLVSAPWSDEEGLFTAGRDYLVARDGREMTRLIRRVLDEPKLAKQLRTRGRDTVLRAHTCSHRVEQLLSIVAEARSTRNLLEATGAVS